MAPPAYGDLGKASKDLFNKHYNFGVVKLDLKSRAPTGIEFNINGVSFNDTARVTSSLETKYNIKSHGIVIKQKWNTDNILCVETTAENYFINGLQAGVSGTFAPQSGKRTGKLSCNYKSVLFNLTNDVNFDHTGAVVQGSSVCGYQGWLAGIKMAFDPTKNKLIKTNFAIGFQQSDFHVTGHLDDGQEFNCSVYQKLNKDLETGINVAWSSNTNVTKFGLGCHYRLDYDSAIRAKINNSSQIGLGFIHRIRPGINLSLSAMVDAKNFSQGGHKLGMGFDLEA